MILIPEALLEQVERGNVLLFIGQRILRDTEGQVVVDWLTTQLATRCGVETPEAYIFPEAAQAYADELGRHALIQFVTDHFERLGDAPQPIHRLIAGLTDCKVLATTCIDKRLERAFAEAGRPLNVMDDNLDVAFDDERKTPLYKLRGTVDRAESLVLTEADYEIFLDEQTSISVVLQGYLARKTILFLGYDLADPHFQQLYRKVIAPLDDYARRAYAFGEIPTRRVASWCKRQGIEVVEARAAAFMEALVEQLARRTRPTPLSPPRLVEIPAIPLPERPYKLLDYYESQDTAIFFGRDRETQQLTSLIHAHRLVLLYGASGTGKTSLLLAGVLPRLAQIEPPYETFHVRLREEPVDLIRRAIQRRLPETDLPQAGSLVNLLAAATKTLERPLVIFFDQFEEFFIRWGGQFRQSFIAELGQLYEARDVPVKLVFSLREDWLASLSEVEARIPELYRTKLRLLPLSGPQARQAITAPLERLGMCYEPALVDKILADLVDEPLAEVSGDEKATVLPPQLQLVCDALYERVRANGRESISLADYEAVGQTGGILTRYLETAIQDHAAQEREVAKGLLLALVTSQQTKDWRTLKSLAAEVKTEETTVERILSRLIGQRLVRRLDDGQTYELVHDILAASIAGWLNQEERQLKQVRELLRREVTDWQQDATSLLSQSKFQRINAVRDQLHPTAAEVAVLLRAAVLYDEAVAYWLKQGSDSEAQVSILLEMLESGPDQARLTAAKYLASFPQDQVGCALAHTAIADPAPAVRDRAAVSLGLINVDTGLKHLVETAQTDKGLSHMQALHALALIQEVAPQRLTEVAGPLRRQVSSRLAKIRFWRNWPRIRWLTGVGAIGGAIGFGLGLAPPITLNQIKMYSSSQPLIDMILIVSLFSLFGLVAGAGLALGLSVGQALLSERPRMGRIVGSMLLGGLAFITALSPLAIVDAKSLLEGVLVIIGSGLFGMLTGLGLTLPALLSVRRGVMLGGGAVGAALGAVVFGVLGFDPFQALLEPFTRLPLLLFFGGLLGLSIAFSLSWAEIRWPIAEKEDQCVIQE